MPRFFFSTIAELYSSRYMQSRRLFNCIIQDTKKLDSEAMRLQQLAIDRYQIFAKKSNIDIQKSYSKSSLVKYGFNWSKKITDRAVKKA